MTYAQRNLKDFHTDAIAQKLLTKANIKTIILFNMNI